MFEKLAEGVNTVYYTGQFEREVLSLKDESGQKKILSWLQRLAEGFPNQPEKWKPLKAKNCHRVYELKPKPYRVCCLVLGRNILAVRLWRIQKNRSKVKSKEIEKCCNKAREVEDDFERFVEQI
ncbi:hypothetical protein [Desulfurobacterium sp.]